MAFVKRTWKDRISEFPNRRTINDGNVTKQVTVGRDEGAITEEGDSFDASNMNDLEQRIEDAYGDIQGLVASEVAQQYDSANVIFDAEPTEGHGTGYTVTSEGIKTAIDSGLVHTNTASGSLVHITDGADNIPVKSLTSEIVAVESGSGTKSPTNPYTISGFANGIITRCGKNLLNNSDKTTTGDSYVINNVNVPMVTGYYVLSFDFSGTSNSSSLRVDDENGTAIFTTTKTITNGHNEFLINLPSKGSFVKLFSNAVGTYTNFQIEQGDTSTTFEAYKGNTYEVAFGQTVYGGELNVTTGELTITQIGHIFDGSEVLSTIGTAYVYNFGQIVKGSNYNRTSTICSHFKVGNYGGWADVLPNEYIIAGNYYFGVNPDMTLEDFKVWLAEQADNGTPVVVTATLVTPTTVQLTPTEVKTLLGENNIFSNCGDVEVDYYVDTKAIYAIRDVIDEFAMQSDWNEADNTKADYIKNKPTIPVNADFNLSGLSDTDISSPSAGQVLTFDGDNWVNSNIVLPSIKYEEINVTFDASGEGTLFNSVKFVVGLKDIPSDQLYVGYVSYIAGSTIKIKALSRTAIAFSSQNNVSSTRKVGVYYLDNIATQ